MDYDLTNDLIQLGIYSAHAVWIILGILLLYSLYKRKWVFSKKIFKFYINSSVFIIAFLFILEMALIVRPAIYNTKEKTINALEIWIRDHQIVDIFYALITIAILLIVNLFFYFKIEQRKNKQEIYVLIIIDSIILYCGIWLAGTSAFIGLMQEVNRHF